MDVVVWLRSLGLAKYEAIFRENDIDETVLPSLTHENLKELGVASFGHRVKLLDAIAALRTDTGGKAVRDAIASRLIVVTNGHAWTSWARQAWHLLADCKRAARHGLLQTK